MNREQLHALLVQARERVQHTEFVIVGSLAILGTVGKPPSTMVMSIDVDTYLLNGRVNWSRPWGRALRLRMSLVTTSTPYRPTCLRFQRAGRTG